MYRVTAAYKHPDNPAAFLAHYRSVHDPLTRTMPHLKSFEWGVCEMPDGSMPPHFVIAVLTFDSKEEAVESLDSLQGRKGAEDMTNFAHAGVDVSFHEVEGAD